MTNEEHNKYISWAFLANGIFQAAILSVAFVFGFIIIASMPPTDTGNPPPTALIATIMSFVILINLIFISPAFIAAYAIKKKKPWARIAAIVAAALSAMNMPLGTLAAVYSLWFFCGENWKEVYPEVSGVQHQIGPGQQTEWPGYTKTNDGEYVYRQPEMPDWR